MNSLVTSLYEIVIEILTFANKMQLFLTDCQFFNVMRDNSLADTTYWIILQK